MQRIRYGVPKFVMACDEDTFNPEIIELSGAASCVSLPQPLGLFVQFFKYFRAGDVSCAIKMRGLPCICDSFYFPLKSLLYGLMNPPKVRIVLFSVHLPT